MADPRLNGLFRPSASKLYVAGLARLCRAIAPRTPHGFLASQCAGGSPQGGPAPLVLSNVAGLARLCRAIAPRTPHGFLASQCAGGCPQGGPAPPVLSNGF